MPNETVSTGTFVEVMQRKLWPLFSGHGVSQVFAETVSNNVAF